MRHQGKPVKRWWFVKRGKQILVELEPDNNFLFSNHWFERFQVRYNISLKRKTHCFPQPPTALDPGIRNFKVSDLIYMDQTPLPFVLDDGKTYDKKVVKEVWAQSGQSGQDKKQATVQLTVFTDGVDRVRPTVFVAKVFIYLFISSLMLTITEQILLTIKNSSKMLIDVNALVKKSRVC